FVDPQPWHRLSGGYDRGYLPHLRAQGRSYFVTFRPEGTLPQEVLRQYQDEREALLAKARATPVGKPALRNADFPVGEDSEAVPFEVKQRLFALYSEEIETCLDAGRGECWLKQPRI